MESVRQRLINAIDAKLRTVTIANGFETDMGNHVFHWKASDFSQSDLPLVEYRDVACDVVEGGPMGLHTFALTMEVEVVTAGGSATPTEIRKAIADVYKVIGQDVQFGGLAINTEPTGDEIKVDQADRVIGGALIRFKVVYRTRLFDPYNQQ